MIQNKGENDTVNPIDEVCCEIDTNNTGLRLHGMSYCNYVHRDWNLTIGEALVTMVAKVERKGDKYIMNYRYYFKDIYEWAYHYEISHDTVSTPLHAAHEAGIAHEYLMQGYYEGNLSWSDCEKVTDRNVAQQIYFNFS